MPDPQKPETNSVVELVESIGADPDFLEQLKFDINSYKIGKRLFALRNKAGKAAIDVARKMDTTSAGVENMEANPDRNWVIGKLEDYANAINADVHILIIPREASHETSSES